RLASRWQRPNRMLGSRFDNFLFFFNELLLRRRFVPVVRRKRLARGLRKVKFTVPAHRSGRGCSGLDFGIIWLFLRVPCVFAPQVRGVHHCAGTREDWLVVWKNCSRRFRRTRRLGGFYLVLPGAALLQRGRLCQTPVLGNRLSWKQDRLISCGRSERLRSARFLGPRNGGNRRSNTFGRRPGKTRFGAITPIAAPIATSTSTAAASAIPSPLTL